jgi:hypothetical protein
LDDLIDHWGDLFAVVVLSSSRTDLVVVPNDADFTKLKLSGYGAKALNLLRHRLETGGADQQMASDALALLVRLQGAAT